MSIGAIYGNVGSRTLPEATPDTVVTGLPLTEDSSGVTPQKGTRSRTPHFQSVAPVTKVRFEPIVQDPSGVARKESRIARHK